MLDRNPPQFTPDTETVLWLDATNLSASGWGPASGSLTLDTSGAEPGWVLSGDDVLEASFAEPVSDEWLTLLVVSKPAANQVQSYNYVFEASDNGTTDRSLSVYDYAGVTPFPLGSRAIRQGSDGSIVSYTFTNSTTPTVHRHVMGPGFRATFENGLWRASSVIEAPYSTPRMLTSWRLGNRFGGGLPWMGTIYRVGLIAGRLSQHRARRLELEAMAPWGLAAPYEYGRTKRVVTTGNVRIVVPDTIPTVVGQPVEIFHETSHLQDGISVVSCTGAEVVLPDRVVLPAAAASYVYRVGAYSSNVSITTHALPSAPRKYLVVGDSRVNRAGFLQRLKFRLPVITFVGHIAATAPYTYGADCGIDGASWASIDTLMSDVTAYRATLIGGDPDVIIWGLGFNHPGVQGATDALAETNITTAFGLLNDLLDRWDADLPTVEHRIYTPGAIATDPTVYTGGEAAYVQLRRNCTRYAERLHAEISRPRTQIWSIIERYDHATGFADSIHENDYPADYQQADAMLGYIARDP